MGRYIIIKNTSRLVAVLLVLTLLLGTAPAVYADGESGTCGDGLTWSLSAGTLTISGSGEMSDFTEATMAPWYGLRSRILRLVLPDGLTAIGDLAFYGCDSLTAVVIPASVTRIGDYAFAGCGGMEMLDLGSVRSVGECAFSDCVSLKALRLPASLESIGMKAFYRCESIPTVTIPASVTDLGISAFSYCKALVSADIQASVDTIPDLLFYGCSSLSAVTIGGTADSIGDFVFRGCAALSTVYHDGSAMTSEEIREMVSADIPAFGGTGHVSEGSVSESVSSGSSSENEDGSVTQENTTVSESENATVATTVTTTHPADNSGGEASVEIVVTVEGEEGWEEAREAVEDALKTYSDILAAGAQSQQVEIRVYVQGSDYIDPDFVEAMSGRDVRVTVMTANGSVWRISGNDLGEGAAEFNLVYELSAGSAELCEELGTAVSFVLRFQAPAQVNAEVLIPLGSDYAYQNATLFQRDGSLKQLQTVVVDDGGYAHLYLASVNEQTDYYIAMNLPDVSQTAIVPDELLNSYGNPIRTSPIEYEITGRTSSWGMTINQVTWIMAGVLVFCVAAVGVVMYALNRRKLKMGYIPDLDDEEEA